MRNYLRRVNTENINSKHKQHEATEAPPAYVRYLTFLSFQRNLFGNRVIGSLLRGNVSNGGSLSSYAAHSSILSHHLGNSDGVIPRLHASTISLFDIDLIFRSFPHIL